MNLIFEWVSEWVCAWFWGISHHNSYNRISEYIEREKERYSALYQNLKDVKRERDKFIINIIKSIFAEKYSPIVTVAAQHLRAW